MSLKIPSTSGHLFLLPVENAGDLREMAGLQWTCDAGSHGLPYDLFLEFIVDPRALPQAANDGMKAANG